MPNLAALRAAVFLLSAKNRWGGGHLCAPPPAVRGLRMSQQCTVHTTAHSEQSACSYVYETTSPLRSCRAIVPLIPR